MRNVSMGDLNSLGFSSGAGGVNHVSEIVDCDFADWIRTRRIFGA